MNTNLQNRTKPGLAYPRKEPVVFLKKDRLRIHKNEEALQKLNEMARSRKFSMHYKVKENDPL